MPEKVSSNKAFSEDIHVIVTGATGFIGRHVIQNLRSRGMEEVVTGVGRSTPKNLGPISFLACDLLTPGIGEHVCEKVRATHLLHLAWSLPPKNYWTSPKNLCWMQATAELTRAFFSSGGKRMVGVGTCVEYAPISTPRGELSTPTLPDTVYGQAKLATCHAMLATGEVYGGSAAWARLFYPFGPGDASHRLIPSVCSAFLENRPFYMKEGERIFDFIDVRDVARMLVDLVFSNVSGAINVASGRGVPIKEVLRHLAELVGKHELLREHPTSELPLRPIVADVQHWEACLGRSILKDMPSSLEDCLKDISQYI